MQRDYRTHDGAANKKDSVGSKNRAKNKDVFKVCTRCSRGTLKELFQLLKEDIQTSPRQPQSHIGEKRDERQQSCGYDDFPPCGVI